MRVRLTFTEKSAKSDWTSAVSDKDTVAAWAAFWLTRMTRVEGFDITSVAIEKVS